MKRDGIIGSCRARKADKAMGRVERRAVTSVAVAVGMALATVALAEPAKPQRIVSINLCTDQLLLDLVARDRIQAVSHLAADRNVSAAHAAARGLPTTRGEAEIVLGFDPDLVLAGTFSTPATVALLERIGRRVVKVGLASDLDGVRQSVREVAMAVSEVERGEAVIAAFDQRMAAVAAKSTTTASGSTAAEAAANPSALTYQVNGLASGSGSLMDAALGAAGFRNHARTLGLGAGGSLPLEALLVMPPDLLVLSGPVDEYRTVVADNLRHPALAALRSKTPSLVLPWRTWLCGTPHIAGAIEQLAEARRSLPAHAGGGAR